MVGSRHSRSGCSLKCEMPGMGDPKIKRWLRVFEDRTSKLLHQAIAAVPEDWYKDDINVLYVRLLWRLESIPPLVNREIFKTTRML